MLIFEELASGNAQSEFEIILISLHVITLERTFASLLKEQVINYNRVRKQNKPNPSERR